MSQENPMSLSWMNPKDFNPSNLNKPILIAPNALLSNPLVLMIPNHVQSGMSIDLNSLPMPDPNLFRWLF